MGFSCAEETLIVPVEEISIVLPELSRSFLLVQTAQNRLDSLSSMLLFDSADTVILIRKAKERCAGL